MAPAFSSPISSRPPPSTSSGSEGSQTDVKVGLSKEELEKIIGDYDGLAVRSATKVDGEGDRGGARS